MNRQVIYEEEPVEDFLVNNPNNDIQTVDLGQEFEHSININPIHLPLQNTYNNDFFTINDILAGYRFPDKMSYVRRSFCFMLAFDVLFIGLMWLICIMLRGENIWIAFDQQIKHYNIQTSLFDIVLAALCRFVVLSLFYAIFYINHWIVISLSTILTCGFLIAKVFYYDWQQSSQHVFEVLLILISFILTWGEAWFWDARVLPQEFYAKELLVGSPASEREPLLRNGTRRFPVYTDSVGSFYSPMQSEQGSIGSLHQFYSHGSNMRYAAVSHINRELIDHYYSTAKRITEESQSLLKSKSWKLEKSKGDESVFSMVLPSGQKIFKIVATINASPKCLLDELYFNIEKIPKWNLSLLAAHKLQVLDEHTDVSYQVSASAAGGLISSRDFVSLRHWTCLDEFSYLIATTATEHPNAPKSKKYVRAENGVCCLYMSAKDNENQSHFEFILDTNLKGWIPQSVLDKALGGTLFDYVSSLKLYISKVQENGR